MNLLLAALLLLAPQDADRAEALRRQESELKGRIVDLERALKNAPDAERKKRIEASIDRLRTKIRHLKEGKIEPESAEPENEDQELARIEKTMTERIKTNPSDTGAYVERAEVRMQLERFEGALKDARKAAELEPGEPFLYLLQGRALHFLSKHEEAQKAFTQAVEIEPDLREEIAEFYREEAPDKAAAMMKAMAKMTETPAIDIAAVTVRLKKNPKDVGALVLRARHSRQNGKLDAAFEDLYAAARIEPDRAEIYFERCLAHAAKGRLDRAERDFVRGERRAKPKDFRILRRTEREMRRFEEKLEENELSAEDIADQIEALKERRAELEQVKSSASGPERDRAEAQIKEVQAEINRLAKLRETRTEGGEAGNPHEELERLHQRLESLEEEMHALARKMMNADTADARKKLKDRLRALVVRFHQQRRIVMEKEIKVLRDEIEDLKFEIQDATENPEGQIEETLEHLQEEAREREDDDEEEE